MARKSGYYWVKYIKEWEAGYFDKKDNEWFLTGTDSTYKDSDFEQINENRIMSPDEWE